MSNKTKTIAFFDFDGTLTQKDTLMPFLKYVAGRKCFYIKIVALAPILTAYLFKIIPNDFTKEVVIKFFLKGYTERVLEQLGHSFSIEKIPSLLRREGMEKLRRHQSEGHRCVLVSASLDVYLKHWSQSKSLDYIISSSLEKDASGFITGDLDGPNCYGDEKVKRIKEAFPDLDSLWKFGYGDSKGDLPLLNLCDYGFMIKKGHFRTATHFDKVKHD